MEVSRQLQFANSAHETCENEDTACVLCESFHKQGTVSPLADADHTHEEVARGFLAGRHVRSAPEMAQVMREKAKKRGSFSAVAAITRITAGKKEAKPRQELKRGATLNDLVGGSAIAFANVDVDNSHGLTFEEFIGIIPPHIRAQHTEETLREAFNMADVNSDGVVSREEYFFWTLRWASENSGASSSLWECFKQYDTTGDGQLNLREFTKAVERFGYGQLGHQLFAELDHDRTGTVSYQELVETLRSRGGTYSPECRKLLTAMSFEGETVTHAREAALEADFTDQGVGWAATTVQKAREMIQERITLHHAKPWDMWVALLKAVGAPRRLTLKQWLVGVQTVTCCDKDRQSDKSLHTAFDEVRRCLIPIPPCTL